MRMQLKKGQPTIEIVEGDFKGRRYAPGQEYDKAEIPEEELDRFVKVKAAPKSSAKTDKEK